MSKWLDNRLTKITADGFGRDVDCYQILAYASALNVPEGMLIYCQRDGSVPPREIEVGRLRTRLVTWALGLSGTPNGVEHRLRELAGQIANRIESRKRRDSMQEAFVRTGKEGVLDDAADHLCGFPQVREWER
jgi:hypothetical protein